MKFLVIFLCIIAFVNAQDSVRFSNFDIVADHQIKAGSVDHLSGGVVIKAAGFLLEADAAEFNENTGEIMAQIYLTNPL